jgi:hypothetical protein
MKGWVAQVLAFETWVLRRGPQVYPGQESWEISAVPAGLFLSLIA